MSESVQLRHAPRAERDAYIEYNRRFFRRWVPFYRLFAASIAPVYGAAARAALAGPGLRLIDVCAGTGEVSVRCARRGAEVVAVDVSPEMLERARSRTSGLAVRAMLVDARRLPFEDDSFDCAVISLALHDMPRAVRVPVLREAARVARHRLVIVDYDLSRTGPLRSAITRSISFFETAYFPRFAAEGVEPLLAEAGLPEGTTTRPWPWLFGVRVVPLDAAGDGR